MEALSDTLPDGYTYSWIGTAAQEKQSANATMYIFGFAFLFVFLFLVALYESWIIPMPVIISTVVALFGGILFINLRGLFSDLYVQIGLVVLIAMASKNAILMVGYCKVSRESGSTVLQSAVTGARLRFRAVVMTSFAFIGGVIPMVFANSVGAAAQQSVGTVIVGGMAAAALIGIFFIPTLYVVFEYIRELPLRLSGKNTDDAMLHLHDEEYKVDLYEEEERKAQIEKLKEKQYKEDEE
jgi:multidrug efflux pump subunit AcrB